MSIQQSIKSKTAADGFTLLEILVALFIFSIVSVMLVTSLYTVINAQLDAEKKAERLRNLQLGLLLMSRDIEQAVVRPISNPGGGIDPPFVGSANQFVLTHAGYANPLGTIAKSTLQRTEYSLSGNGINRVTWDALDRAAKSKSDSRTLISNVSAARFEYLDQKIKFHANWPLDNPELEPLPRAVRITLTMANWGVMSLLYVIPAEQSKNIAPPQPTPSP